MIYADSLFALNMAIDYFLLLCSAKISGAELRRWRFAAAAALGGAYAVACVLPGMGFLSSGAVKLAAAALMASYSGRAVREAGEAGTVGVRAQWHTAEGQTGSWQGRVMPAREGIWQEPLWEPAREAIRAEQKIRLHGAPSSPQPEGEEEAGTD